MSNTTLHDAVDGDFEVQLRDRLAWSPSEFARLSGFSRAYLYLEASAGRLVLRKRGRRSIILRDEGLAWLNAAQPKAAA